MIPALSRSLERESVHKILERMVPSNKNTGIAFELAGQAFPASFYADCQVWEGWLIALYSQSPIASLSAISYGVVLRHLLRIVVCWRSEDGR